MNRSFKVGIQFEPNPRKPLVRTPDGGGLIECKILNVEV
jgi:hypothetical protein